MYTVCEIIYNCYISYIFVKTQHVQTHTPHTDFYLSHVNRLPPPPNNVCFSFFLLLLTAVVWKTLLPFFITNPAPLLCQGLFDPRLHPIPHLQPAHLPQPWTFFFKFLIRCFTLSSSDNNPAALLSSTVSQCIDCGA